MTERHTPYVGVSGVVSPEQQQRLHEVWDSCGVENRVLALGVKAVHKTQWLDIENKYGPEWYPVGDAIQGAIDTTRDNEFRVAQAYIDTIDLRRGAEPKTEIDFVKKLFDRTGDMFNAIQFDLLPWDSQGKTELFQYIKDKRPDMEIWLQAYARQMDTHGPEELVRRLNWYDVHGELLVDRVLFDASHGTGKRLNTLNLEKFLRVARQRTDMQLGVAGGLNATVVREDLPTLLRYYPTISLDAEGQLHRNEDGTRGLNMKATEQYLRAVAEALKSSQS